MAEEEKKLNFILALINTANPSPLSLHQAEIFFNIAKQISKGSAPSSDISEPQIWDKNCHDFTNVCKIVILLLRRSHS